MLCVVWIMVDLLLYLSRLVYLSSTFKKVYQFFSIRRKTFKCERTFFDVPDFYIFSAIELSVAKNGLAQERMRRSARKLKRKEEK